MLSFSHLSLFANSISRRSRKPKRVEKSSDPKAYEKLPAEGVYELVASFLEPTSLGRFHSTCQLFHEAGSLLGEKYWLNISSAYTDYPKIKPQETMKQLVQKGFKLHKKILTTLESKPTSQEPANLLLHETIEAGFEKLLPLFYKSSINLNTHLPIKYGYNSFLHVAAAAGHPLILISLLAQNSIPIDILNGGLELMATQDGFFKFPKRDYGSLAIAEAASHGNKTCLELLIQYSHDQDPTLDKRYHAARINHQRRDDGSSALHLAANHGHIDCISLLLTAGIHLDLMDSDSKYALHLAEENNHTECATLLRTHMGRAGISTAPVRMCRIL